MEGKIRLAVFGQKRLSREGGIEIVVKELCTRMAQNGCEVTCYNRAGHHVSGAEYDKTIEYDGIRQKVVPTIEKKGARDIIGSTKKTYDPQCKLVRAVRGTVFDVAVDLRSDSKSYGKWYGVTLSAENKKQFLIPEGFAHGFLVLSDEAEFCYKVNDFWHPNDEGGMAWNDPEIGIEWPEMKGEYKGSASAEGYTLEDGTALNLSDKDQKWLGLKDTFKF